MYTENKSLGKFEMCQSELVGRILYDIAANGWHDEETGHVDWFGWFGLIHGKRYSFIVCEGVNGFVDYKVYDNRDVAIKAFEAISEEYNAKMEETVSF
jgi:hypothetical protein